MRRLIVLATLVVAAMGGSSPHAEYIKETFKVTPGARYSNNIIEDALLDVPGLVSKYGYPVEAHEVITSDGYILTVHRIPHGRDNNNRPGPRPVVFLMHGLMSSAADWLVLGPGSAFAYYLAEEGYDVWLGNARGTFYSRRHISLDPDSSNQDFWRFSWDEIGNYDLPAFFDHILATTQQPKIHYVGHSQGGTSFLVLGSLRPEYNDKIASFQALAPAAFFTHNDDPMFTTLAPMESILESAAFAMGLGEIFGSREFITWFATNHCVSGSIFESVCTSIMVSGSSDYFNETMIPLFLGHAPAGASVRQFAHYGQSIRFDTFRRYNYNGLTNMAVYGSWNPPDYDLSRINVPTYIHYSIHDIQVHHLDLDILISRLPNVVGKYRIQSDSFDHLDFVWGNRAMERVYVKVLESIRHAGN